MCLYTIIFMSDEQTDEQTKGNSIKQGFEEINDGNCISVCTDFFLAGNTNTRFSKTHQPTQI